ncbi:hypothetical protein NDU88_005725 [Pleurodeles waltl]|uniref:Uncharacterized protein n=1 Tax=Pleurodeles waltl TaxID=8319 RepID=A0AAV7PJE8_PLEWA|nr:hypothetical protein NDU88_005725 [Pleurodeles waltl]
MRKGSDADVEPLNRCNRPGRTECKPSEPPELPRTVRSEHGSVTPPLKTLEPPGIRTHVRDLDTLSAPEAASVSAQGVWERNPHSSPLSPQRFGCIVRDPDALSLSRRSSRGPCAGSMSPPPRKPPVTRVDGACRLG